MLKKCRSEGEIESEMGHGDRSGRTRVVVLFALYDIDVLDDPQIWRETFTIISVI